MNMQLNSEYQLLKNEGAVYFIIILIFTIAPFISFLAALYYFKSKYSLIVFVLFTAVFGYNMVAESEAFDLFRVHELLQVYGPYSFSQIVSSYINTWTNSGENYVDMNNSADIYSSLVSIIVSRFTSNGKVLLAVFGFVFGLVFVNVIKNFTLNIRSQNIYTILIILFASFMMPLHQLAGVRYGTATFFFVLSVFHFIQNQDQKNKFFTPVLLSLVSCFVHFSFVLPVFILFIYIYILQNLSTHKLLNFLYVLYIVSFFFPNLLFSILPNDINSILGDGISNRTSYYTDKTTNIESKSDYYSNTSWLVVLPSFLSTYVIKLAVLIFLFFKNKINHNSNHLKLLSLILILLIIVNFSTEISNLGPRLMRVTGIIFFYYLFLLQQLNFSNKILKNILIFVSVFMSLKILLDVRFIIEYTSLILYYGSVYHIICDTTNTSLWTMIQIWYQKLAFYR